LPKEKGYSGSATYTCRWKKEYMHKGEERGLGKKQPRKKARDQSIAADREISLRESQMDEEQIKRKTPS